MQLIFISGMPAAGKFTVAKELEKITGYKLFHNHLTVDLLLSLFEFGSPPFVELRESIWLSVFDQACKAGLPGLIFTFAPERTVRPDFIANAVKIVESQGGEVVFVELTCEEGELRRRLNAPSRQDCGKLTSLQLFEELVNQGAFSSPKLPAPALSIDTGSCNPVHAASQIVHLVRQPRR
jgi:hypothetical protein